MKHKFRNSNNSQFYNLFNSKKFSDLELIIRSPKNGGKSITLYLHKIILSSESEYFDKLCTSNVGLDNNQKIIVEEKLDILKKLIEYAYGKNLKSDDNEIISMLVICDKYLFMNLKERLMKLEFINVDNFKKIKYEADKNNLDISKEYEKFIVDNINKINSFYKKLNRNDWKIILSQKKLNIKEKKLVEYLFEWTYEKREIIVKELYNLLIKMTSSNNKMTSSDNKKLTTNYKELVQVIGEKKIKNIIDKYCEPKIYDSELTNQNDKIFNLNIENETKICSDYESSSDDESENESSDDESDNESKNEIYIDGDDLLPMYLVLTEEITNLIYWPLLPIESRYGGSSGYHRDVIIFKSKLVAILPPKKYYEISRDYLLMELSEEPVSWKPPHPIYPDIPIRGSIKKFGKLKLGELIESGGCQGKIIEIDPESRKICLLGYDDSERWIELSRLFSYGKNSKKRKVR